MENAFRALGIAIIVQFAACVPSAWAATMSPSQIYSSMGIDVGRVEFEGELYSGETEKSTGSAFLVSGTGLMLTCGHVVPILSNYKTSSLRVRLGGPNSSAVFDAAIVWTNVGSQDLALLRIKGGQAPVAPLGQGASYGTAVVVLGFPVDLDLNMSVGIISGPGINSFDALQNPINPGNSGGPVIDSDGRVVGMVWGAASKWKVKADEIPLQNLNFFVPIKQIIAALPPTFLQEITDTNALPNMAGAAEIRRAFEIDWLKDDHAIFETTNRDFNETISAEPGYIISAFKVSEHSRNNASSLSVVISPDGSSATVSSTLTSGPLYDQWRGWLRSTIELQQHPK